MFWRRECIFVAGAIHEFAFFRMVVIHCCRHCFVSFSANFWRIKVSEVLFESSFVAGEDGVVGILGESVFGEHGRETCVFVE